MTDQYLSSPDPIQPKERSLRNMNPDVQARLLAFQAKRQQKMQQHMSQNVQSSSDLSDSDANTSSDPDDPSLIRRTSFRLPKKKKSDDLHDSHDNHGSGGPGSSGGSGGSASPRADSSSSSFMDSHRADGSMKAPSAGISATSSLSNHHLHTPFSVGGMDQSRKSALPRRAPLSSGSLSSTDSSSISSLSGVKVSPYKPQGLFAPFAKYVDIKSGSLNFAGKASVHSKGVDFSNGSSFRISMDDLEVLDELGRGNYGVVSKVLHKPTGVIMAMKEVRLELDDAKFRQILMELEVLHSCNSECIVDFYGAFFVEGAVYMCIEYMQGGSLDRIYGEGIPELELSYITKEVVKGLKQLKDEHNIIHRDVKPTNMLVNDAGKVKLCDFGVSGNLVASLARTNIGCQSYMAPERIKIANPDVSSYSVQSDIWSLGLSVLEVAKGCYPYPPETYANIFSQLSAIVDGQPPELPEGKFSKEARNFVSKCLSKNPDDRPTYTELLEDPWLKRVDEKKGQQKLAELVAKRLGEKASKKDKKSPALHHVSLTSGLYEHEQTE
ncbi:hypothetical protein FOA43_004586 [Brettanomyces nanus]|uniref:mitogen-activated protein kinase kinase n=1 Tax=Eeniella nana TaxID=13502 RepID=A0A875RQJ5_EENNA|nr:uncharacterized protein FOA43_004586 [Brettanomyces nanus]QPG77180.1 hypothetical protein FOA43_004586 [Brettanomyces nanus]